jgi:peptidoglycan-N-acetylglucosamine deacetylase
MLNYRTANLFLLISILLVGTLFCLFRIHILWGIAPLLIYLLFIITGSANIRSGFFAVTYSSGRTTEKKIALSFDDGPHPEVTPKVLDLLKQEKAPATFFLIGKNIRGNEYLLERMLSENHLIGNHTFSHSFFIDLKNTPALLEELNKTAGEIEQVTGKDVRYFRPPYGVTTPALVKAAKELQYSIIGWNVRSLDTTSDSIEKISMRVTSRISPGAVILFHDTSLKTLEVLKQTLDFAKKNGFKIVSTEELLQVPAYK